MQALAHPHMISGKLLLDFFNPAVAVGKSLFSLVPAPQSTLTFIDAKPPQLAGVSSALVLRNPSLKCTPCSWLNVRRDHHGAIWAALHGHGLAVRKACRNLREYLTRKDLPGHFVDPNQPASAELAL